MIVPVKGYNLVDGRHSGTCGLDECLSLLLTATKGFERVTEQNFSRSCVDVDVRSKAQTVHNAMLT